MPKKRSTVWHYFTAASRESATCNICKKTLAYQSSISNLRRHVTRTHHLNIDETEIIEAGDAAMKFDDNSIDETPESSPTVEDTQSQQTATLKEKRKMVSLNEFLKIKNYGPTRGYVDKSQHAAPLERKTTPMQDAYSNIDACDAYAKTVAFKLKEMDKMQRIFAENLMNQVLYKGLLSQLHPTTSLTEIQESHSSEEKTVIIPEHNYVNIVCDVNDVQTSN